MSTRTKPVSLRILDKDYVIACPSEAAEDLMSSAAYLTKKMQEVRESGKVVSTERIAVMAALNIVHELLHCQEIKDLPGSSGINNELERLSEKISLTLVELR